MALPVRIRVTFLTTLLFYSGACALVYQMVWFREFRLIFGSSTPATAAVLAIFMGGIGLGAAWFGQRIERSANPLRVYGRLEFGVAISAVLTPWLLVLTRALYIKTGGVLGLGLGTATVVHLLLALLVMGLPCTLMGGTLPAAVKWVETGADVQRGAMGAIYGGNTLGALTGVVVSTFWLLERFGNRHTLYAAAVLNVMVGAVALAVARFSGHLNLQADPSELRGAVPDAAVPTPTRDAPPQFVYAAAGLTGFVFFLQELVWYRMLTPLMGGSTYCFGMILSLVLFGVGSGGFAYRILIAPRSGAVTLRSFALLCALQACLLALPYAVGDRVAVFAWHANNLRCFGFGGQVVGWTMIATVLVLGPALLAGIQFPWLVALLGRGEKEVGRQVGYAYAVNTLGAIAGSLLGGFVLLPALTAPGCWRLAAWLMLALSLAALPLARSQRKHKSWVAVTSCAVLCLSLTTLARGPTGVWRHTSIGYGRLVTIPATPNELRAWENRMRHRVEREFEGRESSVAVISSDRGYSLMINGKSDGSALTDAATQVMSGLLGALLHPHPTRACVVGLGTGSTAGWLAEVQGMQRVDVIELEPAVPKLASSYFAAVNRDVVGKVNVHLMIGDAREVLLVAGAPYDLIASEPSNPYRAGVTSLYTREFYQAVQRRLAPGGIFTQWVQGYDVDTRTIRLVYATLASVFPYVETWSTQPGDLMFVCHQEAPAYSAEDLRQRVLVEPFAEALKRTWYTSSAEGVIAHYLGSPALAREIRAQQPLVNTDDRNLLEYSFARSLSSEHKFHPDQIMSLAIRRQFSLPEQLVGKLDISKVDEERLLSFAGRLERFSIPGTVQGEARSRDLAIQAYINGDFPAVLQNWKGEAESPMARLILAEAVAHVSTPDDGRSVTGAIKDDWPVEAELTVALAAARTGAPDAAVNHLREAFTACRKDPWVRPRMLTAGIALAQSLVSGEPKHAQMMFDLFSQPLAAGLMESTRAELRTVFAGNLPPAQQLRAIMGCEPDVPWTPDFLEFRQSVYHAVQSPRAKAASRDLVEYWRHADKTFAEAQ
jgi:spermidine synthase